MPTRALYGIRSVALRTGLSAHVIRIWEKRYGAVDPKRTPTNRRRYSEQEIERLALLRDLTRQGHGIGQVASLSTGELRKLSQNHERSAESVQASRLAASTVTSHLETCLEAVKQLDARRLEEALNQASTRLGAQGLLQQVVAPLATQLGVLWRDGLITAAHEHFASAVIRMLLSRTARPFAESTEAPVLLVATPLGQLHELGALLVAATAANLGWKVTYLGASLPAAELAGAAHQTRARAVALSLVYPEDDSRMSGELARLRELLPAQVPILAGGGAAEAYRGALHGVGALLIGDLHELCFQLEQLRKGATPKG